MSNFANHIPFVLHFEAGLSCRYMSRSLAEQFAIAKCRGYANDASDSGGPTMCGVTLKTYSAYRRRHGIVQTSISDLKSISFEEWSAILKTMYWDKWHADRIKTPMIASAVVDWLWGSGRRGITMPQEILGVKADGIVGPKTIAALNDYADQRELFAKIQAARNAYHASIARPGSKNAKFLKGWNRRVAAITWDGFDFEAK